MNLVHEREQLYFVISLFFSIIIYLLLVLSIIGFVYLIVGLIVAFVLQGLFIGRLKGNGILLSEKQFPDVYSRAVVFAQRMGFTNLPSLYIIQSGGLLNAFATRFLGRNYVILYSEIFELAYEQGEAALDFVICHELAHIKRKHLFWNWLLLPASFIPFLSSAYSRACEYTCDRFAVFNKPDGAEAGLLILSVGKKLYKNVDVESYLLQTSKESGFWLWFGEILSSHPNLPKRIEAARRFMISHPAIQYQKSVAQQI